MPVDILFANRDKSDSPLNDDEPLPAKNDEPEDTAEVGRTPSEVGGVTKADAKKLHDDILNVIKAPKFDKFKALLKRGERNNKKSFDKIDPTKLAEAIKDLKGDDLKFVKIVANTINSDKPNTFQYFTGNTLIMSKTVSSNSRTKKTFVDTMNPKLKDVMLNGSKSKGITSNTFVLNRGGGLTIAYDGGTHSILDTNHSQYDAGITSLHEIFGHGRPVSIGRLTTSDADAIRFENLAWRVLGMPEKQRDGSDHGDRNGVPLPNPKQLRDFE